MRYFFLVPKGMCRYVTLRMDLPGDRLPEVVTSALVVGIMQNHRQMKATSLYFHLVVDLHDSDHQRGSYDLRKSVTIFEKILGARPAPSPARPQNIKKFQNRKNQLSSEV